MSEKEAAAKQLNACDFFSYPSRSPPPMAVWYMEWSMMLWAERAACSG